MDGRHGGGVFETMNAGIQESSRKVIQSLKEIVNCSYLEIYMMLIECDFFGGFSFEFCLVEVEQRKYENFERVSPEVFS